jgi:glycosyltransferase involved in cell wall biosynthesis
MEKMRIAFFNWRDIKNPMAGGAEVYNHELLKRLADKGHKVTIFTSLFPGAEEKEVIDGIEHIRYGGKFGIYLKAYSCYKKYIEGKYDVIIEGINGMPFFTRFFAREKVVPLVYQLTRQNWYSGLPFPAAFAGYHMEDFILGSYRKNPAITISESTKSDLEKLGFSNIGLVYAAGDVKPPERIHKEKKKTIAYIGRLTKSKRVDHVLIASEKIPDAEVWIIGDGPERDELKKYAKELGVEAEFLGKVNQKKKAELLSRAHLMLFPAVHEGWGITVLEANACGTPVIGYDVHGLRDSIENGVNGYLVKDGDVNAMAECAVKLLEDKKMLEKLSADAVEYSKNFSWDKSADGLLEFLEKVIK